MRHQAEFPKTHSLERLLDLVAPISPELAASLEEIEALTVSFLQMKLSSAEWQAKYEQQRMKGAEARGVRVVNF